MISDSRSCSNSPPPKKHKSSHQALTSQLHQSSLAQRKASPSASFHYLVICSKLIHMTELLILAGALLLCINVPSYLWRGGVLCYECKVYVCAQKFYFLLIRQFIIFPCHDHQNLNLPEKLKLHRKTFFGYESLSVDAVSTPNQEL